MKRLAAGVGFLASATSNFFRDRGIDRAAVIAYFGLLSFVPIAVILVAVGAFALGSLDEAERGTELVLRDALYALPPEVMAHARLLQEGIWSGVFYLPITLWSASMVFGKIESSLDHVFRVDVPRHWALRKLLAFGMVLGLSVLLVGTLVLGGLLAAVDRYIGKSAILPLRGVPVYQMVNGFATRYLVPWLTAIGAFFLVYRIVPARAVPKGAALVAAVVAGSLWEILKLALTYYVASVAVFTRAYGALATLVIFLVWVHLSAAVLLWGGELAAAVAGFREAAGAQRAG
jgi:membrane protein